MFNYTVETHQSVGEAVSSLEASLSEAHFGVLWDFDAKDTLHKKGLEFEPEYRILEVCNPKEAQRVLNQNRLVGYFLPCKIVVYEEGDQTKIGMPKPTELIGLVGDDVVLEIARDIEERLIHCIEAAS
ncbi:DUF302 domain-containing protein [Thalassobacillus sp. CUG 92003]|uniref:DUF302 domain-containing protein n=1 Tax=Thalassobacillus sp. CUG 92003 TaxID=2736641 RepID=UPI0015E70133|nr:DUF302 domain-containing protein [Thalassobacillus sp. CUG 92003]